MCKDSIIEDCEQALVHWIPARAAVKSKLSGRSRSQSAVRRSRARILLAQDRSMETGSRDWVPASEHERKQGGNITDDDGFEDIEDEDEPFGQHDGRHHRHHPHANGHSHAEDDTEVSPPESRGNEARQRSTKGVNVVAGQRERATEARGEIPASFVTARATQE